MKLKHGDLVQGYQLRELLFSDGVTEIWKAAKGQQGYTLNVPVANPSATLKIQPDSTPLDFELDRSLISTESNPVREQPELEEGIFVPHSISPLGPLESNPADAVAIGPSHFATDFPGRCSSLDSDIRPLTVASRRTKDVQPGMEPRIDTAALFGLESSVSVPRTSEAGPDAKSEFPTTPQPDSFPGESNPDFVEGTVLDERYEVVRKIGAGGSARIYLARDRKNMLQGDVVIRIPLRPNPTGRFIRRLMSQFKVWKALSDSEPQRFVHLISIEKLRGPGSEVVGIFMEYFPDGDLGRYVGKLMPSRRPVNQRELTDVTSLLYQACLAVSSLHRLGFLHRDLKPTNFVVSHGRASCKLTDFELAARISECEIKGEYVGGTRAYMAPEVPKGKYSVLSDVYSLGASMYHLLCGEIPQQHPELADRRFGDVAEKNTIIPLGLSELVAACVEEKPENRPQTVDEINDELLHLGLTGETPSYNAPANLARLVLGTIPKDDLDFLADSLRAKGLQSVRAGTENLKDLIAEYCYTGPPDEILESYFTNRQLGVLAGRLGVKVRSDRMALVRDLVVALGFLPGPLPVSGLSSAIEYLGREAWALEHSNTPDETTGIALSSLSTVERIVDMFNLFFGQLLHGRGVLRFLGGFTNRKDGVLTLGQKLEAFRSLLVKPPSRRLPYRYREAFRWPIVSEQLDLDLGRLLQWRNTLAHAPASISELKGFARDIVTQGLAIVRKLAENPYCPQSVQIISMEVDSYGRQFYCGRADQGRLERIFTPLPLNVGEFYLFYPLTNPARVHPLLFPLSPR